MIRPARRRDAAAVGGILSEFIDTTDWMPRLYTHAEERRFAQMMIARGWVMVAVPQDRAVAGFMARDGSYIHALYVAQPWRSHGIGRELVAHAQAQAPHLELRVFQHNLGAQRFYARQGFQAVEQGDGTQNDEGLPDIRLIWERALT